MLSVDMLSVFMLSVVILIVVAPLRVSKALKINYQLVKHFVEDLPSK